MKCCGMIFLLSIILISSYSVPFYLYNTFNNVNLDLEIWQGGDLQDLLVVFMTYFIIPRFCLSVVCDSKHK